jgi:glutathione S-transferase
LTNAIAIGANALDRTEAIQLPRSENLSDSAHIILHGMKLSGHSHRVELFLNLMAIPYQFRAVDLRAGDQKTPEFLAMNRFATVPVIEDGDFVLADSAAILVYLAGAYDPDRTWLPTDPKTAAKVQRWLSVAQGPVFNGPALARVIKKFAGAGDHARAIATAAALLGVLNSELEQRAYLVDETPTLADVAIYSYVARAPDGEVSLEPYPNVRSWLRRVESWPRFLPMPELSKARSSAE